MPPLGDLSISSCHIANMPRLQNFYTFPHSQRKEYAGFSIVELAIVLSVLSILSAISIPNILKWVQLARIDEAKSILNSAAADCLTESRSGAAAALAATPRSLDADRLSTTGYQIKDGKDKCQEISIAPASADDKLSYEMGFRFVGGRIEKFAFPANDQSSLNSCKAWAGSNCGASEAQLAEWARLAAIQAAKQKCNDDFNTFRSSSSTGQRNRWDDNANSCTQGTWVFQGNIQRDEAAFNEARERALGAKCRAEYEPKVGKLDGIFTYSDPACGQPTYFCSGRDLGSANKVDYDACKADERIKACKAAEGLWIQQGINGKFSEAGCESKWQCNKAILTSQADYDSSTCKSPPVKVCRPPDIWYCPWRPTWQECQPICN
jgi:type II secretory pathway pseudopilin PulG